MTEIKLNAFHGNEIAIKTNNIAQFLEYLTGPSVIHLSGKDPNRTRVICTLLHGNEPSGLKAIFKLLKSDFRPAVNIKFIIASVTAARTEPLFYHRMLPGDRDLNRCFGKPYEDSQGQLAKAILEAIQDCNPEAIWDIHNTSGTGPAFAVASNWQASMSGLTSPFTHRVVITNISLCSLMEAPLNCPVVTIECGGSDDEDADNRAYSGIKEIISLDKLDIRMPLEVFNQPRRLELKQGYEISYRQQLTEECDATLFPDIEQYNFGITEKGTQLGVLGRAGLDCFRLNKEACGELSDYFENNNGQLRVKLSLKLFMVTTRADIAAQDCLFYFVPAN